MKSIIKKILGCMVLPLTISPIFLTSCNQKEPTVIKHTVTFYLNDGTETVFKTVEVEEGKTLAKPSDPERSGYTFNGWYTQSSGGEAIVFPKTITADESIYAHWEEKQETEEEYLAALNIDKTVCSNGYLIESTYTDYPFITNDDFINKCDSFISASCSSFFQNSFYGRNFEWQYSNHPEMIIHTKAKESINRYATLGVAYCSQFENPSYIGTTGRWQQHKNLPWYTVDGINEKGLVVSINEVPIDSVTIYSNQGDNSSKTKLNELQLVRYLLDYCSSVADCQEKIKQYNIVGISGLNEQHIMVADSTGDCAEIEFVPLSSSDLHHKSPKFFRKDEEGSNFKNIITNFTMIDYAGDCDANWYQSSTSLGPKAEGCERYNILYDKLITQQTTITSLDEVLSLMSNVYYTNSYAITLEDYSPTFWFSEFNYSTNSKTTEHLVSNYSDLVSRFGFNKTKWDAKEVDRSNSKVWCTINSSAYDLKNKQLKLVFEEKYPINKIFKIDRSQQQ